MTPTELVKHLRSLQENQGPFDSLAFFEAVDRVNMSKRDRDKPLAERYLLKVKERHAKQDRAAR